jgi:hypothetical protein
MFRIFVPLIMLLYLIGQLTVLAIQNHYFDYGVRMEEARRQKEQLELDNWLLRNKIAEVSSLKHIEQVASREGFIKAKYEHLIYPTQ